MLSFSIQKNFLYMPFLIIIYVIRGKFQKELNFKDIFNQLLELSSKLTLIIFYFIEKQLGKNEKQENSRKKGKNMTKKIQRISKISINNKNNKSFLKKIKEKFIKLLLCIIPLNLCYYNLKNKPLEMDDYLIFIILLFFLDSLIIGNQVYSHQILSIIINIFGIIFYYSYFYKLNKKNLIFFFVLILKCYCRAFNRILLKYISINYFINIFLIVSILGFTGILYLLIRMIFNHNFIQFPYFKDIIIYDFIIFILLSIMNYFLYYKIIYELGPIHAYITEFIGFFIIKLLFSKTNNIIEHIIFIIFIISSLIYCEIIVLNFCRFNHNVIINVRKRALNDFNDLSIIFNNSSNSSDSNYLYNY